MPERSDSGPKRGGETGGAKGSGRGAKKDEARRTGMRALAAPLSAVAKPVLKRRGLAGGRIVAEWPEIVGASLAGCSCPERLNQPRNGGPGTLKIRVDGPLAIELQHLEPVIIERINGYFGYRAVERLSMVRGPLPPRKAAADAPPVPDETARRGAAEFVVGVEDDALRAALESLGGHVLARSARGDPSGG